MANTLAVAYTTIYHRTFLERAVRTIIPFITNAKPCCRVARATIVANVTPCRVRTVTLGAVNAMKVVKALTDEVLAIAFFYAQALAAASNGVLLTMSCTMWTFTQITSRPTPACVARATSSGKIAETTHSSTLLSRHKLYRINLIVSVPLAPHVRPLQWPVVIIPLALHAVAHEVGVERDRAELELAVLASVAFDALAHRQGLTSLNARPDNFARDEPRAVLLEELAIGVAVAFARRRGCQIVGLEEPIIVRGAARCV